MIDLIGPKLTLATEIVAGVQLPRTGHMRARAACDQKSRSAARTEAAIAPWGSLSQ